MELIAQGTANIASGIFGGIPATGAIARTVANIKNGGRTPVAGMVHAIVLLLIMLMFMPYAKLIPLSSLAAILIIVAYNMSEWREFKALFKAPKSDVLVLLITFIITVLVDLVVAIEIGVVLACLLFMKRMSDVTSIQEIVSDKGEDDEENEEELVSKLSDDILIYEINGPFFFGAADKFVEVIDRVGKPSKVLVLRMRNVPAMDATAYHALNQLYKTCKKHKTKILISSIQAQPYSVLEKAGFIEKIGEDSLCLNLEDALNKIKKITITI